MKVCTDMFSPVMHKRSCGILNSIHFRDLHKIKLYWPQIYILYILPVSEPFYITLCLQAENHDNIRIVSGEIIQCLWKFNTAHLYIYNLQVSLFEIKNCHHLPNWVDHAWDCSHIDFTKSILSESIHYAFICGSYYLGIPFLMNSSALKPCTT